MFVDSFGSMHLYIGLVLCISYILTLLIILSVTNSQYTNDKDINRVRLKIYVFIAWLVCFLLYLMSPDLSIMRNNSRLCLAIALVYPMLLIMKKNISLKEIVFGIVFVLISWNNIWMYTRHLYLMGYWVRPIILMVATMHIVYSHRNSISMRNLGLSLEEIMNNLEDMIIILNKRGKVVYSNEMFNMSITNLKHLTEIGFPTNVMDKIINAINNKSDLEIRADINLTTTRGDLYLNMIFYPYMKNGKVNGYIITLEDVTDIVLMIEEGKLKNEDIREINDELVTTLKTKSIVVREKLKNRVLKEIKVGTVEKLWEIKHNIEVLKGNSSESNYNRVIDSIRLTIHDIRKLTTQLRRQVK